MENYKDKHQEIRQGVRALCSQFSAEYHRKVDAEKGYPKNCRGSYKRRVDVALIPEDYGGSGLSLTEATVIMEEINRAEETQGHAMDKCII